MAMAAALSSSRRGLHTLHRHLLLRPYPSPAASLRPAPTPNPRHFSSPSSRFFTTAHPEARHKLLAPPRLPQHQKPMQQLVVRKFATGRGGDGSTKLAPLGQGVKGLGRPVATAKNAAARYREAVGLQAEAFWRRNYMLLVGAGGVIVCIALWRVMFGIASTFVGLSEGMAKCGKMDGAGPGAARWMVQGLVIMAVHEC